MLNLEKFARLISPKAAPISTSVGSYISINNHVYIDQRDNNAEITEALQELSSLDSELLKSELERSAEAENSINAEISKALERWNYQAGISWLLQHAIEIVETDMPDHSGNQWEIHNDCATTVHTISNAVYLMEIEMGEGKKYSRNSGIVVPKWTVSWHVVINMIPSVRKYTCYGVERAVIAGKSKAFSDMERAETYLDSIRVFYAHYFKEEVPPVPRKYAEHFMKNGVLLPGYTLEPEEEAGPDTSTGAA